jgi:photosystem II stability/assembly factor-like uncharacterized protein
VLLRGVAVVAGTDTWLAVGSNSTLLRSTDGALSWADQRALTGKPDVYAWNAVEVKHAPYGWVVGSYGAVLRTANGGGSWVSSLVTGTARALFSVASVDTLGLTAVAVGERGTILRTDDGGGTWSTVDGAGVTGHLLTVAFVSQERGFIAGDLGNQLLRTINRGLLWAAVDVPALEAITTYTLLCWLYCVWFGRLANRPLVV